MLKRLLKLRTFNTRGGTLSEAMMVGQGLVKAKVVRVSAVKTSHLTMSLTFITAMTATLVTGSISAGLAEDTILSEVSLTTPTNINQVPLSEAKLAPRSPTLLTGSLIKSEIVESEIQAGTGASFSDSNRLKVDIEKSSLPLEPQADVVNGDGKLDMADQVDATNIDSEGAGLVENQPSEINSRSSTTETSASVEVVVPQAESVDLSEPVERPSGLDEIHSISANSTGSALTSAPASQGGVNESSESELSFTEDSRAPDKKQLVAENQNEPLIILGAEVLPGASTRLSWKPDQSFEGIAAPTPVLVVNGLRTGPTVCLTAAIHGDELNGIEIVRRVLYEADPEKLSGTLIGVPIVNLHGFHRTSRYLPDRRDLNRYFPGNPEGSSASRIAYSFFNEIIRHCDALVDLHTGSFRRTNLPQVRADLTNAAIVDLSQSFGATVVLHNSGTAGTLRRAAAEAGIPAITLEAGEPMRLQQAAVNHGVKGIETLLNKMAMYKRVSFWGDPEPVFYRSKWIRANQGGILFSEVELGERVRVGELLGTVTDPITNVRAEIQSPFKGRVLGRALDQVVMPGFAAFRIGIETSEQDMQDQTSDEGEGQKGKSDAKIEAAKIMNKARAMDAIQNAEQKDASELSE